MWPSKVPTGESSAQKAAGQSGPRPRRWGPRAAGVGGLWGLCFPALFEFLPLEFQYDPGNLVNKCVRVKHLYETVKKEKKKNYHRRSV